MQESHVSAAIPVADNCSKEQIQIPGAIQSHGVLFVLDDDLVILQVSANVGPHLGMTPDDLLGKDIRSIVQASSAVQVEKLIRDAASTFVNPFRVPIQCDSAVRYFDGIAHQLAGVGTVLELEEDPNQGAIAVEGIDNYLQIIQRSLAAIDESHDAAVISKVMAEEIKSFTGFDRVMVYRFAEDFHGEVIGEAHEQDMEPYLGLHFPASDIPAQARALYRRNLVRLLHDVDAETSPLVPAVNPRAPGPLDMSRSVLRAMSPVHIQYLKNMGVASSLSVSLIVGGRLWGLIACHHRTPRFVSYSIRATASLYALVLAAQLDARQHSLSTERAAAGRHMALSILSSLQDYSEPLGNLRAMLPLFMELFGAHGVALMAGAERYRTGIVPEDPVLADLAGDLSAMREGVIMTHRAAMSCPSLAGHEDLAAGLVGIHLGGHDWLVLFRRAHGHTVRWAGDPRDSKTLQPDGTLNPRKSFGEWLQRVEGESEPWPPETTALTTEVRSGILEILRQRNMLLSRSNEDLKRFAGVVAHEVKNHLQTGILALALMAERFAKQGEGALAELGTSGRDRLMDLSKFTNDLLKYSGTDDSVEAEPVVLETLVKEVADELETAGLTGNASIEWDALPRILAAPIQIRHAISNLVRNALIHGRAGDRPLRITLSATVEGTTATISITDDGRGIPPEQLERIFEYFYRGNSSSAGSGIGLAYCAQVFHRMGQRLWVEPGEPHGAVFRFTVTLAG